jgi:hypothetical protein
MFTETKSILKNTLLGDDVLRYQSVMTTSDREYMEKKLTPWVVVYLPWFPELKAEPCVFVHIMTVSQQRSSLCNTSDYQYSLPALFSTVCVVLKYRCANLKAHRFKAYFLPR